MIAIETDQNCQVQAKIIILPGNEDEVELLQLQPEAKIIDGLFWPASEDIKSTGVDFRFTVNEYSEIVCGLVQGPWGQPMYQLDLEATIRVFT